MEGMAVKQSWLQKHRKLLLIGGPTLFLLVAAIIYVFTGRYMSTDDAYIQIARAEISSNVSGRVIEIAVKDNQEVRRGDLLFKLDDRDFINALNDAKAKLASAKLQVMSLKATYWQREADLQAAITTTKYLLTEYRRQKALVKPGISSKAQLDQATNALLTAEQNLNANEQELAGIRASLNEDPNIQLENHPLVQQAQAVLDQAELNLSYTIITAPIDGITSRVEQLTVGDYINSSTPVFGIVSKTDIWVEANFKETELTYMRPGQKATFTVDTYPDKKFKGTVVSISPCTGSSLSLLPPENATGNWVKVVQRLPVRISIDEATDPKTPLRMGLSVTAEVDTEHTRLGGH